MRTLSTCHPGSAGKIKNTPGNETLFTLALAGNANVGKSVIFNQLTGSKQIIGNWPGKTVESAEGVLTYDGLRAKVVDLPGIYSLSTYSIEELISREYIAKEKPDVIINVIGAPVLERNLYFTLQLMEMDTPLIVCLNQMDIAAGQGITIDAEKLEKLLGVPVVATVAARGEGIPELCDVAFHTGCPGYKSQHRFRHGRGHQADSNPGIRHITRYSADIEEKIDSLTRLIDTEKLKIDYPARWAAIKLLEGDVDIKEQITEKSPGITDAAGVMAKQFEEAHRQPAFAVITGERYSIAGEITRSVQARQTKKMNFADRLDWLTTHKIYGYLASFAIIAGLLIWTFTVGTWFSGLLSRAFGFFQPVDPGVTGNLLSVLWNGMFGGLVAGVTLVIPYVIPFYLMLAALEDSGLLTRVAFMLDSVMHQMGLHGKAIIPIILGYGCNVPAIYATRIMGSRRERLLAAFAITFSPCAARTIIIFGLVAAFLGIWWALGLYVFNLLLIFLVTRIAMKVVPGESTGLIMEMHSIKTPSLPIIAKQTWSRTKGLILMVFPIYMAGTAVIQVIYKLGILTPINNALSFLTVGWLGLPLIGGVLLIFGAARKELILLMAVALFGSNLALHFTSVQLITLALVGTIYPCFATIGVLTREFGWKSAWAIIAANVATALLVGGIAAKLLLLAM